MEKQLFIHSKYVNSWHSYLTLSFVSIHCIVTLDCGQLDCADIFILIASSYQWYNWIGVCSGSGSYVTAFYFECFISRVISWNIYLM